jgi:hypothetical protein
MQMFDKTKIHAYLLNWYLIVQVCLWIYVVGVLFGLVEMVISTKLHGDLRSIVLALALSHMLIFGFLFVLSLAHLNFLKRSTWIVENTSPQLTQMTVYPFNWFFSTRILLPSPAEKRNLVHVTFDRQKGLKPLPELAVKEITVLPALVYKDPQTNEPVALKVGDEVSFIAPFPYSWIAAKAFARAVRKSLSTTRKRKTK